MLPLDNPIWHALTGSQAGLAESSSLARRFIPDVSPLGGFAEPTKDSYAALSSLLSPGDKVGLFLHAPPDPPVDLEVVTGAPLLQMIYEATPPTSYPAGLIELGASDVPEMIALTHLTKPGPFNRRTHELGDYFGIRADGKLVAMAGERLRLPGYTEISAVCTHPDHLGHGYAARLITTMLQRICSRNEQPFLHVRADNNRAIALYERLGFARRLLYRYAILGKTAPYD